jgi:hypothetical protein
LGINNKEAEAIPLWLFLVRALPALLFGGESASRRHKLLGVRRLVPFGILEHFFKKLLVALRIIVDSVDFRSYQSASSSFLAGSQLRVRFRIQL